MESNQRLLRLEAVCDKTGLKKTTIYKLMGEGRFPKSVPIIGRTVGWSEREVDQWISELLEARDAS